MHAPLRIEYGRYGGPEVMQLQAFAPGVPGANEVLVRVKAAGINPVDWKVRNGDMRMMTGRAFPRAMGTEFSGVVESAGAAVTRLRPGDEVFGAVSLKPSGAFAEMLLTSEKLLAKKPAAVPFEAAACLSVAPVAAWQGLVNKAKIAAGQKVFVAGCCGAVGRAAVQIAKMHGALVTGSCGAADIEAARQMGVDLALDYNRADLSSLAAQFDVVFDTAGKLSVKDGLALLLPGRGVMLDLNNFTLPRVLRSLLTSCYKIVMGKQTVPILETLAAAVVAGKLQVDIGRTAPLERAIALIADVELGSKGKGRAVILMG